MMMVYSNSSLQPKMRAGIINEHECMRCENKLETIFDQLYIHCNTKQGRTANKQGNAVLKTGLSCNRYRIFPVTGKNRDAYKVISL